VENMSRKPMYKRKDAFTVLKQIRLTSKVVLKIGGKIESCKYPNFRLLKWYRKGMIAQSGSEYVKEYLKSHNIKYNKKPAINLDEQIIPSYYQPVLVVKEEVSKKPKTEVKKAKRKYTKKAKK
jgi:hypothetical protein